MIYYRCKCGNCQAWSSMGVNPCDGCPECNTTLETGPEHHEEPKPHDFVPTPVETDEGPKPLSRCRWCMRTPREIERVKADYETRKAKREAEEALEATRAADGGAEYDALVRAEIDRTGNMPHCDSLVLHKPGECEHCDERGTLQQWRIDHSINFTGHNDTDKKPCFAERRRTAAVINRWGGNVAHPKGE